MGIAIDAAQFGELDPSARPLKGFHGASVIEIRSSFRTDAYRAVYTVQFGEVIYVLHAFQKKAKHGIATPKQEIEVIKVRLEQARAIHRVLQERSQR